MSDDAMTAFLKLGENNYPTWKFNMQAALQSKKVWCLVDGRETRPADPALALAWDERAEQASGFIYQKLERSMQIQVQEFMDDPVKMWNKLQLIHQQDNPASRFIAFDNLLSINKGEDESLTSLLTRAEEALNALRNTHSTTLTLKAFEDEITAALLLRALPEEYSSFRSALLLMTTFDLKTVKEAFIQEQKSRQPRSGDSALALKASTASSKSSSSSKPTNCDFCGIRGHVEANCYKKRDAKKALQEQRKKKKDGNKEKGKANSAEQENEEESAEFAGNASIHDYTSPTSPIISDSSTDWIADTGATSHMTCHRHWFTTYSTNRTPIRLANNEVVYSVGIGSVRFQPVLGGKPGRLLEFERVLHVPALRNNLLSVLYLTRQKSYTVTIKDDFMRFVRNGTLLFTATVNRHNAAHLDGQIVPMTEFSGMVSTCPLDLTLWHRRFAHLNHGDVRKLINAQLVNGIEIKSKDSPDPICEPCIAGKQTRSDVSKIATHRASGLLQLVHSDVHGPLPVQTRNGYKYWITFIDDFSRHWAVLPLKKKSDAFAAFKQFKAYAENQLGVRIKATRDDKGGEYMPKEWDKFCESEGIHRQHTVRDEPHQNGVAERANRTLAEGITTMLNEAHLPSTLR